MKTRKLAGLSVIFAATLGGCVMPMAGTQDIQLSITPMMATCEAHQHGGVVGRYDPSRQSITVPDSPGSTEIICTAPGYKDKRVSIVPSAKERWRAYLTDFGPAKPATYPGTLQIMMEAADRPGKPA